MNFISSSKHIQKVPYRLVKDRQLEIWSNLLGLDIKIGAFFKNPLRTDNNPGARLKEKDGIIRLFDASSRLHSKNVFEAISTIHGCNFSEACSIAYTKYINAASLTNGGIYQDIKPKIQKRPVKIGFTKKYWSKLDKAFWNGKTGITKQQLEQEKYYSVKNYWISDKFTGEIRHSKVQYPTYVNQIHTRYKVYTPKLRRFLTNFKSTDIGGFKDYNSSRELWLTKNGKSYMCLCNTERNSRYVPHEGVKLHIEYIIQLSIDFDVVYILYDNDETGIKTSLDLAAQINTVAPGLAIPCTLPTRYLEETYIDAFGTQKKVSDPYDITKKYSLTKLDKELNLIKDGLT